MVVSQKITVEIGEDAPARLDSALARFLPAGESLSRTRIAGLIRKGAVSRNDVVIRNPSHRAGTGEIWTIAVPHPEDAVPAAENIELSVVYEDDDVLVIDKASGMVVHPARGNWQGTLVNALLYHCGEQLSGVGGVKRPGIVHRLDKDTTGLMVIAKTDRAVEALVRQFGQRTITRTYHAVVRGMPDIRSGFSGYTGIRIERGEIIRIEGSIGRHPASRLRRAVVAAGGRPAVTRVRMLRVLAAGATSLVECQLETGRTHQIRVHLERVGHPLVGDQLYGTGARALPTAAGAGAQRAAADFCRQALHAATLEFDHPATGVRQRFSSPLPADINNLVAALSAV